MIAHRLHGIDTERQELIAERAALLARLQPGQSLPAPAANPTTPGSRGQAQGASGEWRADTIRDVLLWVGGSLLVLAAGIFAAFAWKRLDDTGRAALLVGATVVSSLAAATTRTRLTATAEALGAVSLGLVVVDWFALRRAGVGTTLDLPLWWAMGSALVALLAAIAGRFLRSPRAISVVAASAASLLVVATLADRAVDAAVGLGLVAAAVVTGATLLRRLAGWQLASAIADAIAVPIYVCAGAFAIGAVADSGATPAAAGAVALLAAAPAALLVLRSVEGAGGDWLTALSTVVLIAAGGVLQWDVFEGHWPIVAVCGIGAVVAIAGFVAPVRLRAGVSAGGLVAVGVGVLSFSDVVATGLVGVFGAADTAWSAGPGTTAGEWLPWDTRIEAGAATIAVLLMAAVVALADGLRRGPGPSRSGCFGVAAVGVAAAVNVVPLAASTTVVVATVVTGVAALAALALGALIPDRAAALAGTAAVTALPAFGWSLATQGTTLVFLAVLCAGSVGLASRPVDVVLRRALAMTASAAFVGLTGCAAAAAGGTSETAGVAAAAAAGSVLLAGSLWRDGAVEGPLVEVVALAAMAVALALAFPDPTARAIAFTVAAAATAVAGARRERSQYLTLGTALGLGACWSWLVVADIEILEAYTTPAAAAAFIAGSIHRAQNRSISSWVAFGPGLVTALGPSLVLAINDVGIVRPALLAAVAVAVVAIGAAVRLQAPLVAGAVTLVLLAVDTFGPAAAAMPRWLSIGLAGGLLLFFGATAERRLNELRRLGERFAALEPRESPGPDA